MIDSTGEPSFCWRSAMAMIAKQTPLTIARVLPSRFASSRPSAKKSAMPAVTTAIVIQSARVARSWRNQAPNSATQTGAVYWRRMALAAVVSLVAMQNVTVQPA